MSWLVGDRKGGMCKLKVPHCFSFDYSMRCSSVFLLTTACLSAAAVAALFLQCAANPEEIEIGDDDDDEGPAGGDGGEEDEGADVQEKAVPAAVFGSLAGQQQQEPDGGPLGALERFKKRRVE